MRQSDRRHMDGNVQAVIEDYLTLGWTPAQIDAQLQRMVTDHTTALCGLAPPSLRTIQRMAKAQDAPQSAVWGLDDSGAPARFVLDALAEVLARSERRRAFVTVAEARWIVRVNLAAPGIPPWWAYRLARAYITRGEDGTEDLDAVLAFRPWDGAEAFSRYESLVETARGRTHPEGYTLALALSR